MVYDEAGLRDYDHGRLTSIDDVIRDAARAQGPAVAPGSTRDRAGKAPTRRSSSTRRHHGRLKGVLLTGERSIRAASIRSRSTS